MGLGSDSPGKIQRPIALQPEALHLRARIVPRLRGRAVGQEHPRRGIVGRGVRVEVDVVFVQRPNVATSVGRFAESDHPLVAAELRVGRQVVGQLHVVALPLPNMLDDGHVIHALVFQRQQVLAVALVRAVVMPPHVEHDSRTQQRPIG